jgi:hypothetical protein
MADFTECVCSHFFVKLGKMTMETYEMLKSLCGEERVATFE